ncbi:hypothetical protein ACT7CZ_25070 [Bacillus cereus]
MFGKLKLSTEVGELGSFRELEKKVL